MHFTNVEAVGALVLVADLALIWLAVRTKKVVPRILIAAMALAVAIYCIYTFLS
jgi:hypothetical protein